MRNIAASINKDPGSLLTPLELVVDDIDNDESLAEVIEAIEAGVTMTLFRE